MSDYGFQAYVDRQWMFSQDLVRLLIRRRAGLVSEYLMSDGTWTSVEDGIRQPDEAGVVLPAGAIEAIATAIAEFQGHASHADTEARVLREWLAVERGRVDKALG